jgi:hypothetical protein
VDGGYFVRRGVTFRRYAEIPKKIDAIKEWPMDLVQSVGLSGRLTSGDDPK